MNALLTSLPPATALFAGLLAGALLVGLPAGLVVWIRTSRTLQARQLQIAELAAQLQAGGQQAATSNSRNGWTSAMRR